jgi:hypothetical protein
VDGDDGTAILRRSGPYVKIAGRDHGSRF